MTFLRNTWYAAAWDSEVRTAAMVARTIADEAVLLWRGEDGSLSVMADLCPHRLAPLSKGRIECDRVRCGYHGLAFATDGRCVDNPHGPLVAALKVRTYPAVERDTMIWVWLGDPAAADPDAIPDLGFVGRVPPTALSYGYLSVAADHKLMVDNVLDLSHADFLHPTTLGGGGLTRARARVEERGDMVYVAWFAKKDVTIPILQPLMPTPETPTDTWTDVLWHPSGAMVLSLYSALTGRPREEGVGGTTAHMMTPETAGRTHYFYCQTRNYMVDDADYNRLYAQGIAAAFDNEDKPMIEAQQRRLGHRDLLDCAPVLLPTDAASTRARRIYARLLAVEAAAPKPVAA